MATHAITFAAVADDCAYSGHTTLDLGTGDTDTYYRASGPVGTPSTVHAFRRTHDPLIQITLAHADHADHTHSLTITVTPGQAARIAIALAELGYYTTPDYHTTPDN